MLPVLHTADDIVRFCLYQARIASAYTGAGHENSDLLVNVLAPTDRKKHNVIVISNVISRLLVALNDFAWRVDWKQHPANCCTCTNEVETNVSFQACRRRQEMHNTLLLCLSHVEIAKKCTHQSQ